MILECYLYRGVNAALFQQKHRGLEPKLRHQPFSRPVYYGEDVYYSSGATYGESPANAVIMHQQDSSKYPSPGISTTPSFEKAKAYATHHGKYERGYVFKIDTTLLKGAGVRAYPVSDYVVRPAIPDDWEVILVADDLGVLPDSIIVEVIDVVT